jgi:hypothetical protein
LSEVEESTNHATLLCRGAYTRGVIRVVGGNKSIIYPSMVKYPHSYRRRNSFRLKFFTSKVSCTAPTALLRSRIRIVQSVLAANASIASTRRPSPTLSIELWPETPTNMSTHLWRRQTNGFWRTIEVLPNTTNTNLDAIYISI